MSVDHEVRPQARVFRSLCSAAAAAMASDAQALLYEVFLHAEHEEVDAAVGLVSVRVRVI
jgi:hypothetical protein